MSLIMDALEKVQRETKPFAVISGLPVMELPTAPVFKELQADFSGLRSEDSSPIQKKQIVLVFLFVVCLFTAAVVGFEKISAGLALPETQTVLSPKLNQAIPQASVSQKTEGPGVLRGVLEDPAGSFCILGEQILKTGDTWRGYTVLSIEAQQVVVQDSQNRLLTLYLQES